jgi:hypothetical protein
VQTATQPDTPVTPARAPGEATLARLLAGISVRTIHRLKRQHGLRASGPTKAALVDKLAARLAKALRRREAAFAFCPTGPGGGVDPTCGKGEGKGTSAGVGRPATRREASQVLRAAKAAAEQAHDLSYELPREMDRDEAWKLRGLAAEVTFEYRRGPDDRGKKSFADRAADAGRLRAAALDLAHAYADTPVDEKAGESRDLDTLRQLRQIAALALRAEKAFARLATPKAGGAAAPFAAEAPASFTPWAQEACV